MGMLHTVQQQIAALLKADQRLARIEVITQADGDIDTMIRTKVQSLGIVIIIGMGKAGGADPAASGPYFEDVVFVVEVQEHVMLNRSPRGSRMPVLDVCELVAGLLHHAEYAPGKTLYIADPGIVPAVTAPPATSAYAVALETSDGIDISQSAP